MLPALKNRDVAKGVIQPERIYVDDEKSNFAEAIRTIRTGLTLSAIDSPHKVILFTSSEPAEGKTTAACNTALSFSQLENTLIFDADLRRPSTNKIFGYDHNSTGMSDLLTGNAEYQDVIHKVEGTELSVITAGTVPPDPLDLLASKKFKRLLEELSKRFDRIIIDSPPVSLVSDAVLLASLVDAVVYVIKADDTNTKLIESSLRKLKQADAHIVGAVLNAVNMKKLSKYYGYGYGKYYGDGYYAYDQKA
jgi:capsular exopolysaccharide synthesis family protein